MAELSEEQQNPICDFSLRCSSFTQCNSIVLNQQAVPLEEKSGGGERQRGQFPVKQGALENLH